MFEMELQLRNGVAPDLPVSIFCDTLKRMEITLKKEPKYKECEMYRQQFFYEIKDIDPRDLVYIDGSGVDDNIRKC